MEEDGNLMVDEDNMQNIYFNVKKENEIYGKSLNRNNKMSASSVSSSSKVLASSASKRASTKNAIIKDKTNTDEKSLRKSIATTDVDSRVKNWFQWTLCYSNTSESGDYYAINIHKANKNSKWLEDFINYQHNYFQLCPSFLQLSDMTSSKCNLELPATLQAMVENGWISFYDSVANVCSWMHIPTGQCEMYLKIRNDDSLHELASYICRYDENNESEFWVYPDQSISSSWIMVQTNSVTDDSNEHCNIKSSFYPHNDSSSTSVVTDSKYGQLWDSGLWGDDASSTASAGKRHLSKREIKEWKSKPIESNLKFDKSISSSISLVESQSSHWYYLNTRTEDSQWEEPCGWDQIVASNSGWSLCLHESTMQYYW